MSTPPFDTADARLLALVASQTPTAGHTLDRAALITTILDACAEVERLQALLAPTRANVETQRRALLKTYLAAVEHAAKAWWHFIHLPHADEGWDAARLTAKAARKADTDARAALDAFERAHGLDLTHPDAGEPCPGSRGW